MTNGFTHPYQLDESTFIFRGIGSIFSFSFHFLMKIKIANRIAPDWSPRLATSHLGQFCLPMSHKKDARLIWVNMFKLSAAIFSHKNQDLYLRLEICKLQMSELDGCCYHKT